MECRLWDIIEGVTYTSDAQGNPAGPVNDAPGWKRKPPEGWQKHESATAGGNAPGGYSLASNLSAADRKKVNEERKSLELKAQNLKDILAAMQSAKTQDERIENGLKILRIYTISPNGEDKVWASAIRELTEIGKPAVPKLIEELDRTDRELSLRALGFVLRAIGDPRAIPALIRAIPRTLQPSRSDYGLAFGDDPELLKFMAINDNYRLGKGNPEAFNRNDITFNYGRPIREIMPALEKMTGQKLGWTEINFAANDGAGVVQQRLKRVLFLKLAERWADWWSKNWQKYVDNEADAQLDQTKTALVQFADLISKMPHDPPLLEIPHGPKVTVADGNTWSSIEQFLDLDTGRQPPTPKELINNSPKDIPSKELIAWAEKEGVDLIRIEIKPTGSDKAYYAFQPVAMKVWRIDNSFYDDIGNKVRENKIPKLSESWEGPISSINEKIGVSDDKPASFLFITKEGVCGAMQINSPVVSKQSSPYQGGPASYSKTFEYKFIYENQDK